MAAEDAGRASRARRAGPHRPARGGAQVMTSAATIFGRQAGARRDFREVARDDFPKRRPRSRPSRRLASCIVLPPGAAHRSSTVRPSPAPSSRAGIEAARCPAPTSAPLVIAGQVRRSAVPRGEAEMARQQADARRGSAGGSPIRSMRRRRGDRRAAAATTSSPHGCAPALRDRGGQRRHARAAPASARITAPNTPWTSLRGPPSTSGSTVEIAAWCGVPSASAWTSAMRSAKRALASSGRRFRVARSISASRSGRRRSASAAMAWAKARSSARSRSRAAASSAASSGSPLRSTASSSRKAARREAVPGGSGRGSLLAFRAIAAECGLTRPNSNGIKDGQAAAAHQGSRLSVEEPAPARAGRAARGRGGGEGGGPKGLEPTRYGDWENNGICWDF